MNKEIKIIDLLNMIAEGKERPNYIKYRDISKHKYNTMYVCKENIIYQLDQCVIDLNDTVEIIEEDNKIEKLDIDTFYTLECKAIGRRINQIIDKINNI